MDLLLLVRMEAMQLLGCLRSEGGVLDGSSSKVSNSKVTNKEKRSSSKILYEVQIKQSTAT